MNLTRFLSIVGFITCFSLLYVYQQTEIFRLAYTGQKKEVVFQDLLDKNYVLKYNIKSGASLTRIGNKISGSNDFQMPDTYRLVRLAPTRDGFRLNNQPAGRETLLSKIFGVKRQAEARTITP
ncbi:MAG: hypothetical protein HY761_03645 [Candidatus Omnitrophica bacterium]|nr:hypothetical protein [Candidatus Omnitrophota bacterium]